MSPYITDYIYRSYFRGIRERSFSALPSLDGGKPDSQLLAFGSHLKGGSCRCQRKEKTEKTGIMKEPIPQLVITSPKADEIL